MREAQAFGKQGSARPAVTLLIAAETRNAECEMRRVGPTRRRRFKEKEDRGVSGAGSVRGGRNPRTHGLASPCLAPARGALPLSLPLSAALAAGGSRVFPPGGGGLKYDKGGVRTAPCGPNPVALAQT